VQPDRIEPQLRVHHGYVKTAGWLAQLRDESLGPAAFDDAFREYTRRWAFKHPAPADFFKTMENVSGRRLDWFFRQWFLENPHYDIAIDSVIQKQVGDIDSVGVQFGNRARGVLPIRARFTFTDGTTEDFNYPAEVWSTDPLAYDRLYAFKGKKVSKIEVDPDKRSVDTDRANNVWPR